MKTATTEFSNALALNGRYITARLLNTSNVELTADIVSLTIEESTCDTEGMKWGGVSSSRVEMDVKVSDISVFENEFIVQFGLYVGSSYTYVTMGRYLADSVNMEGGTAHVVAYDKMLKAQSLYVPPDTTNGHIFSISSLISGIATSLSVTVVYDSSAIQTLAGNLTIDSVNTAITGYTKREMLSMLSMCLGAFCYFGADGYLHIARFGSGGTLSVTEDMVYERNISSTLTEIDGLVVDTDGGELRTTGSNAVLMSLYCPIMSESIFNSISSLASAISDYHAGSVTLQGNMLLDLRDKISYVSTVSGSSSTYVMYPHLIQHVYDGGLTTLVECYARTDVESETNYKGPEMQRMERMYAEIAAIKNLYANAISTDYLDANYAKINLANIETGSIKTAMIDDAQITSAKIGNAAVGTAQIQTGAITNALIATAAVDTAQLADASITDAKIVSLSANRITSGTLATERLILTGSNGSIVYALNNSGDLVSQSVDTIDGNVITDRTITADKIVASSITSNELASNSVTANKIVAGAVTTDKIGANAVTAAKIDVSDLFSQNITFSGTLTGGSSGNGGIIKGADTTYVRSTETRNNNVNNSTYSAVHYVTSNGMLLDLQNSCFACSGLSIDSDGRSTFSGDIVWAYYTTAQDNGHMGRKDPGTCMRWTTVQTRDNVSDVYNGAEISIERNIFNYHKVNNVWTNDGDCMVIHWLSGELELVAGVNVNAPGSGADMIGRGYFRLSPASASFTRSSAEVPTSGGPYEATVMTVTTDGDFVADRYVEANQGIRSHGESRFDASYGGGSDYSDPLPNVVCAIKATGNIATTGKVYSNQKECVVGTGVHELTNSGNVNLLLALDNNLTGSIHFGDVTSDIRCKKNVADTKVYATDYINRIDIKSFDWNYDRSDGSHVDAGFIAQQLEEVIPRAVYDVPQQDGSTLKNINHFALIPYLVKALQEQNERIEKLEKRISELEKGE